MKRIGGFGWWCLAFIWTICFMVSGFIYKLESIDAANNATSMTSLMVDWGCIILMILSAIGATIFVVSVERELNE